MRSAIENEQRDRPANENLLRGISIEHRTERTPRGGRATTYTVRDDGKRLIAIYFYEPGVNCWYNSYDMKYRKSRDETVAAIIHGFAHSGQDRPHGCAECLFYETGDRYCTEAMRRSGPTMPMCIRFVHDPMHTLRNGE